MHGAGGRAAGIPCSYHKEFNGPCSDLAGEVYSFHFRVNTCSLRSIRSTLRINLDRAVENVLKLMHIGDGPPPKAASCLSPEDLEKLPEKLAAVEPEWVLDSDGLPGARFTDPGIEEQKR